jgi:molecular chaperone Hsp33
MDKLVQGTAAGGTMRVLSAITTGVTAEAVRRHLPTPTAAAALGRVMTGTLLLGATQKEIDRLTVKIEAAGPVGGIVAETPAKGIVRGYIKNPEADAPAREDGKLNVSGIVGKGTFYVIREAGFDIGLHRDPYVGSVPLVSGEIAEDFAYYLARSEQIPSAVILGVLLQKSEPLVAASGGVLVQMLPGADERLITMVEDTIQRAPHITSVIRDGATPKELAQMALGDIELEILEESPVEFRCNCSMEKASSMIAALGRDEVVSMLTEDRGALMTCGFCSEVYQLDESHLEAILGEAA